jgi:hypothetical protein
MDLRAMDIVKEAKTGDSFAVVAIVQHNDDGTAYADVGRLDGQGGPLVLFLVADKGDDGFIGVAVR